jgi:DsbC/DsbD-like thiol-disulfide interchange protein
MLRAVMLGIIGLWGMLIAPPPVQAQIGALSGLPPATISLLDSGMMRDGARLAGLSIDLQPDFKTYWRNPGDSGLPPVFDWSRSKNVRQVEILWPVPQRFDDQAGSSIGYEGRVILPLRVRLDDPQKEAVLTLSLSFGVCKTICIPAKGEASLRLPPGERSTSSSAAITQALALVPLRAALDGGGAPIIQSAQLVRAGVKWALEVEALVPSGGKIVDLFVEGPDSWLFGASLAVATGPGPAPGVTRILYQAPLEDVPPGFKAEGTRLTLTLASDQDAIETSGTLDAAGRLH